MAEETKTQEQQTETKEQETKETEAAQSEQTAADTIRIGDEVFTKEELENKFATYKGKAGEFDAAKRELARSKQIMADFAGAQKGDPDAIRRLGTYQELGISKEHIDQALVALESTAAEGEGNEEKKVNWDDLSPEIQEELLVQRDQRQIASVEKAHELLDKHLDKDDHTGHIMRSGSPKLVKRAKDYARGELRRRAAEAKRDGLSAGFPRPQDFQAIVQDVRAWSEDILGTEPQGQASEGSKTGMPGIGRTPLGRNTSLYRNEEPPKRVKSEEDGYSENLLARLQAEQERLADE